MISIFSLLLSKKRSIGMNPVKKFCRCMLVGHSTHSALTGLISALAGTFWLPSSVDIPWYTSRRKSTSRKQTTPPKRSISLTLLLAYGFSVLLALGTTSLPIVCSDPQYHDQHINQFDNYKCSMFLRVATISITTLTKSENKGKYAYKFC